jgi:hypothetical protein
MVLGTCVILNESGRTSLKPESIIISGKQSGFLVNFTVKQLFRHSLPDAQDIRYLVPNNSKICMYGTTFRIGDEEIRVVLEEKKAAEEIFIEAKAQGRAALLGQNLGDGLVEFSLGNIPPGEPVEVSVECAFTASSSGPSSIFFKFPLDVCTPSGSVSCITGSFGGTFQFTLENCDPSSVLEITTGVPSTYCSATGLLRIDSAPSVPALMITTTFRSPLRSLGVRSGRFFSVTIFSPSQIGDWRENNEFIFLIDCSGSMSGDRIGQARVCLTLFIRSLPPSSFFNVIRFGSDVRALVPESVPYNDDTAAEALSVAEKLRADLGGTEIYAPLTSVFGQRLKGSGVRQLFVITDGEVSDTDNVIALGRSHASQNRCFAIGIGNGADAGMIEGLTSATGGRADFTSTGKDLPGMVIQQLEASLSPGLANVSIEVSGYADVEIEPFPIPAVTGSVAQTIFGANAEPLESAEVLVHGDVSGKQVEERISCGETIIAEEALRALFAFETIMGSERLGRSEVARRSRVIGLSIASGVLCSGTAFVGFSNRIYRQKHEYTRHAFCAFDADQECCCCSDDDCDLDEICPCVVPEGPDLCCAAPDDGMLYSAAPSRFSIHRWSDGSADSDCSSSQRAEGGCLEMASRPAAAEESRSDQLLRLISLQNVNGSWSDAEQLKSAAGVVIDLPSEVTQNQSVLATALAIAILRKRFMEQRIQWQMIERKALRWLSGEIGDAAASTTIDQLFSSF